MKKKIVVLGTGLVGKAIAIDLQKKYNVIAVDLNKKNLNGLNKEHGIDTITANVLEKDTLNTIIADCDIVIGAVPSEIGMEILRNVIQLGKNIVDISFFQEDPFQLDKMAEKNGVIAVVDCGIAPGLSNIILGHHSMRMNIEKYECYVGGIPEDREWPWEYKTVFPPSECIEEYLQPGYIVQDGKLIKFEALSEPELIDIPSVGTLEGLITDGLRTLKQTIDIPNMFEKTLRYPGITNYLKVLQDSGFFSNEEILIGQNRVKPYDLTAKLIFPKWIIKPGEKDITVMQLNIVGEENGKSKTITYTLVDRFDTKTNTTSMARTTGYTCAAVADLILQKKYNQIGISPPEFVGKNDNNFEFINEYLKERGVNNQIKSKINMS